MAPSLGSKTGLDKRPATLLTKEGVGVAIRMKPNKRLRGHALELAKQEAKTLPKGSASENVLSEGLLSLWSHGHLSAKLIQNIANKALLVGAEGEDLATIARSGNHGSKPGNCHRDICRAFIKDCHLGTGASVPTQCQDPKTSKPCEENAGVLLPHLLFSELFEGYPSQFDSLFGTQDLAEFWTRVEATKDDRLQAHPICLDKRQKKTQKSVQNRSLTIPLFLHADGVEFQSRDSLLVWNWGGFLNAFGSLNSHFLICAFPKSASLNNTWEPIMEWVQWSFEAMQEGTHPCYGPDNGPLPKGSIFEKLAGLPLTGRGYRACIWAIQGDQEMYSNILNLPHWNTYAPCAACDAQKPFMKGKACEKGKSFKELLPENQKFEYTSTSAALTKGPEYHALFRIPGLTIKMVRQDGLHVLFVKGVCSHLLGSLLHQICFHEGKGRQSKPPKDRLALVFSEIQANYKAQNTPTRLTNLRLSMFCDPAKPHKEYPKLEAKGAETKHLLAAFLPVLQAALNPGIALHQHMVGALEAMVALVNAFDSAGMFPTQTEFQGMQDLDKRFCYHYTYLHQWAKSENRKLYHIVYKFHCMHHLVRDSQYLNPRYAWNFRAEDFVGKVSKLAHSVMMGVKATKLSGKLLIKYRILLHMQLTQLGFDSGMIPESDGEDWL